VSVAASFTLREGRHGKAESGKSHEQILQSTHGSVSPRINFPPVGG
jgi:hypothetical protein